MFRLALRFVLLRNILQTPNQRSEMGRYLEIQLLLLQDV
jgi:hypothetical protein